MAVELDQADQLADRFVSGAGLARISMRLTVFSLVGHDPTLVGPHDPIARILAKRGRSDMLRPIQ